MKLYELIDRWQRRQNLKKIILEINQEIEENNKDIIYVSTTEKDLLQQRNEIDYIFSKNKSLSEQLKFYKDKLNELL